MTRRHEEKEVTHFILDRARWERFEDTAGAIGEAQVFSEKKEEREKRAEKEPEVSDSKTT